MTNDERRLVRATWPAVAAAAGRAAESFYAHLFHHDPSLRLLFVNADLVVLGHALLRVVGTGVANLERLERLVAHLDASGAAAPARPSSVGATDIGATGVGATGAALLAAVEQALGAAAWTPAVREAWTACCALLARSQRVTVVARAA